MLVLVIILSVLLALAVGALVGVWISRSRDKKYVAPHVEQQENKQDIPIIIAQPDDQTVLVGKPVELYVQAVGEGLTYSWRRNDKEIVGETGPHLRTEPLRLDDNGVTYSVTVRSQSGVVKSRDAKVNVRCNRIIAGDPSDPALEVCRLEKTAKLGKPLNIDKGLLAALSPMLQHAPGLLLNTAVAASDLFVVKYSPNLMQGLSNGTYSPVFTADGGRLSNVSGEEGFVGHGEFFKLDGMNAAALGVAAWQVMAMITAQHFMAEINKRLAALEDNVREIRKILEQEMWSKLNANFSYLTQIANTVSERVYSSHEATVFLNQVENIDRECSALQNAFESQVDKCYEQFQNHVVSGVGLEKNAEELVKIGQQFSVNRAGALVAMRVRGAALQVRLAMPLAPDVAIKRFHGLSNDLQKHRRIADGFSEVVKAKVHDLKGFWSLELTDVSYKKWVTHELEKFIDATSQIYNELQTGMTACEELAQSVDNMYSNGIALAVQLTPDGNISQVNELLSKEWRNNM